MTTEERKMALKEDAIKKYERLKYDIAAIHLRGEISDDDYRIRRKHIAREENLRLAEIDQMSYNKAKYNYEKLMKKNSPGK